MMGGLALQNSDMQKLADEHRNWLSPFARQYLVNWEKVLSSDCEAAMTEAAIRRLLQRSQVLVEPNESLVGTCGGPDYRCTVNARHFYVEVTCVTIATAEKRTGIIRGAAGTWPFNVMGMAEAVFAECKGKARQCANLDAPVLVAIGTFHSTAAMVGFKKVLVNYVLTGETKMAWDIDVRTGQQAGGTYQATELSKAAFFKKLDDAREVEFARNSISGVLMSAVGLAAIPTLGVLHPNPARPFDSSLLPGIEFGRVEIDRASRQVHVCWQQDSDD